MAQFYKKHGSWYARISWRDLNHKRHTKSKGDFKTKMLAREWAIDQQSKLNTGIQVDKSISLSQYYWNWVKTYKENKVADITYHRYKNTGKVLEKFFHQTEIKQVNRQSYQQFINQYGSKHAPDTVKKVNSIIRSCVKSAILDGYITRDFTQRVELVSDESRTVKVEYLNMKEIHTLVHVVEKTINTQPAYTSYYMILTAIYTGMRLSEIQALTWADINLADSSITINKSWDAVKHQFKPTKNKSSVRTIAINPELVKYLKRLRTYATSTMAFCGPYGTIPTSNAVNKVLRHLLESIGLHKKNFHFHSLRHSHVALLLANGIDIYAISKRLGHSSVSTTSNVYAYLIDEYKQNTDEKIVRALSNL